MAFPDTTFTTGTTITSNWLNAVNDKCMETVSVKDFGAVGDGVTDDTAAIQAAIAYINTTAGGALYVPTGKYAISSKINFGDRISVYGDGANATVFKLTGAGIGIQFGYSIAERPVGGYDYAYSLVAEGFAIECNANTTKGLYVISCIQSSFRNIYISAPNTVNSNWIGVRVSGANYVNTFETISVEIPGSVSIANGIGFSIGNGQNEVGNINALTNVNTFINCKANYMTVGVDVMGSGCSFINLNCEQNLYRGIWLRGPYNNFTGTWLEGCSIVTDSHVSGNGSGGSGATVNPVFCSFNGSAYPIDNVEINNAYSIGFNNHRISTMVINPTSYNTTVNNCIISTLTDDGNYSNLRYQDPSSVTHHNIKFGSVNNYKLTVDNSQTKVELPAGSYYNKTAFSNFELNDTLQILGEHSLVLPEVSTGAISAPSNCARLFATDNGSGKTQLWVKFATGVGVLLAQEP